MRGYAGIQPNPHTVYYCSSQTTAGGNAASGNANILLAGVGITLLPTLAIVTMIACWKYRASAFDRQVKTLEKLWQQTAQEGMH